MKKVSVLLILFITIFTLSACKASEQNVQNGLKTVKNASDLSRLLSENRTRFNDYMLAENTTDDDTGDSNNTHSETNVQVEGVDEGDIIKTDGNRIYYSRNDYLTVIEINDGDMTLIMDQKRSDETRGYYRELFLTEDKLVVIGNFYDIDTNTSSPEDNYMWLPYYQTFTVIEVYDKATLAIEDSYTISGHINTTRLKDDILYIVSSDYIYMQDDADIRPTFTHNDDTMKPAYNDIFYIEELPTHTFTILTTIDLGDATLDYTIFLGVSSWNQVYMSHQGIYLSSNYYQPIENGDADDAVSSWDTRRGVIISYAIDSEGLLEFSGIADYRGYIINQFAMDEYNGMLRIITTDGFGDNVVNRLYIFTKSVENGTPMLKEIALLDEGIGKPRETVRSVRFNQEMVTVVTFEQTDPFYIINLEDPENPVIEGELEITGFSTYQHLWEENRVIGIGYETNDNGQVIGLKLALYDTSDASNPVVINEPLILLNDSNNWQYAEALFNHKALLISNPHDFIGFSINAYYWYSSTYYFVSNYMIFTVDDTQSMPISIGKMISHVDRYVSQSTQIYKYHIDRAVTINNHLFVFSNGAVTQHDIENDYTIIEDIKFNLN